MKKYLLIPLVCLKSLFLAVTQVAWGLVSIFGLNLIMTYFLKEGMPLSISETFLILERFIAGHVLLFVGCFFALYLYFEIKEIIKS